MAKQKIDHVYKMDVGADNYRDRQNGINIIPYFTIPNLFTDTKFDNGFELMYTQAFETDPQLEGQEDMLDLKPVFSDTNTREIIRWHNKAGIANEVFIRIIVMRDNDKLVNGKDYIVDYEDFRLIIKDSRADCTYRLCVFLNNLYVQDLMENYNNISSSNEPPVGRVTDKTVVTKKESEVGIK